MPAMDKILKNRLSLLFFTVFLSTCGSGSSTGEASFVAAKDVRIEGSTLVSSKSDLVVTIPADLPSSVRDDELKEIYSKMTKETECQNHDGAPLDLLLVETCLKYHEFYLYPLNLPTSLDKVKTARDYVDNLHGTDPHTFYYTLEQYQEQVAPALRGETAKIGIRLEFNEEADVVEITEALPFYRGWNDGLRAGDLIIAVNTGDGDESWIDAQGLPLDEVQELLPMAEDAQVRIRVARQSEIPGESEEIIEIDTAAEMAFSLALADGVGYVSLRKFTTSTMEDVKREIDLLTEEMGAMPDRLILDLRSNGGGSVEGALNLADYLIDNDGPNNPIMFFNGTILHDEGRYLGKHRPGQNIKGLSKETFVVLVNGNTASASEILLKALMHYNAATVVGTNTYGKGVRQDVKKLVNEDRLFITSHYNLGPDHEPYHGIGVLPDKIVDVEADLLSLDYDPQLDAAFYWATTLDWSSPYAASPR